jgi:hypothetical protein
MDDGEGREAIRRLRKRVISDQSIADIVERTCRSWKIYGLLPKPESAR